MAYQAMKHKQFVEEFELVDENGEIKKTIHVKLDADDIVVKLNRKYAELTKALAVSTEMKRKAQSNEDVSDAFEKLGNAAMDLFEAVFGKEDTKVIVEFYEGRYIEMVKEVTPFITKCVIPRCIEIKKENQKNILKGYNRKQRRALFGKKK